MNRFISRKFVYRVTTLRIFAFTFVLGVLGFLLWQSQSQLQTPMVFVVQILPEIYEQTSDRNPSEQDSIIQNRNLSEYAQMRVSDCVEFTDVKYTANEYQQCENNFEKGRDFSLQHWKEKKRTYLIYEWTGVDNGGEIHFFIEPDENGQWHIIIRSKERLFPMNNFYKIKSITASSIKRKRINKEDYPRRIGKFYLSLIDGNGKEIEVL